LADCPRDSALAILPRPGCCIKKTLAAIGFEPALEAILPMTLTQDVVHLMGAGHCLP
jgi:hypothetical protein